MSEWSKETVLKTVMSERASRVRISPPPLCAGNLLIKLIVLLCLYLIVYYLAKELIKITKINMTTTWVIIGVFAVVLLWIISVFNSLIKQRNRANNALSDIDVQLKRRYDLVPNLLEAVKGYKNYEASVLENVTKARSEALNLKNSGANDRAKAEGQLTSALKNLFAIVENYPQLMASESFRDLQKQLSSLENDIQSARRYYNAAVRELNNATQVFPANIVATIFSFKQLEFFGADKSEKEAIKVSL